MIQLLNDSREHLGSFASYTDLVDHILKTELSRLNFLNSLNHMLEVPHAVEQRRWMFSVYKHSFLKNIYSAMKEPPLTEIEREAFQQELDLIEIHYGSTNNMVQIPVTEDTDIESLKKDFCLSYSRANNYVLLET